MMSRKHYIALAFVMRQTLDADPALHQQWGHIQEDIALMLRADNSRFDWNRFYETTESSPRKEERYA